MALSTATSTALQLLKEKLLEEKWDKIFDRCLRGCEEKDNVRSGQRNSPYER